MKNVLALSLAVVLLGACSSPGAAPTRSEQPEATLDGLWLDYASQGSICEGEATTDSSVELTLKREQNRLRGSVTFVDLWDGTEGAGSFDGELKGSKVTGQVKLVDRYGNNRSHRVSLDWRANTLTGTLEDELEQRCPDGTFDAWLLNLNLIPRLDTVNPDGLEANDSSNQATLLKLGSTYELSLTPGDEDWLAFELGETSVVTVSIELRSVLDFDVAFLTPEDLTKNLTANRLETHRLETQSNKGVITLSLLPGKHYIHINSSQDGPTGSRNGLYSVKVEAVKATDSAFEPNNTKEQATKVTLDFPKTQLYLGDGDQDWFTFTLTEPKLFTASLTDEGGAYYTLYDSESNRFNLYEQPVELRAGTYFVQVYGGPTAYALSMTASPLPDAAFEPNNSLAEAKPITLDFRSDLFLSPYDADWFKFTVSEAQMVSVSAPPVASDNSLFKPGYALYDATEQAYGKSEYADGPFTSYLLPGTYYLEVGCNPK